MYWHLSSSAVMQDSTLWIDLRYSTTLYLLSLHLDFEFEVWPEVRPSDNFGKSVFRFNKIKVNSIESEIIEKHTVSWGTGRGGGSGGGVGSGSFEGKELLRLTVGRVPKLLFCGKTLLWFWMVWVLIVCIGLSINGLSFGRNSFRYLLPLTGGTDSFSLLTNLLNLLPVLVKVSYNSILSWQLESL